MEVKVQCPCGTLYKFEVEPLNGRMPGPIRCPSCGADGTPAADAVIQESLAGQAQAAVAPPVAAGPAAVSDKPRIRLNAPARVESAAPAPTTNPPLPTAVAGRAPLLSGVGAAPARAKEPNILLGIAGAVVGGALGMLGWYFLIKATRYEIGYAAWGVGALTGVGARVLGHHGSPLLGICAGACALIAIVGGQFLAARSIVNEDFDAGAKEAYETQLAYAKEAVQAVPTEADTEIRAFLASQAAKDGGSANPKDITADEIQEFRKDELPKLRALANGKQGRKEFDKKMQEVRSSFIGDFMILKESLSLLTLLWLFLGVGSAYKIASGGSD